MLRIDKTLIVIVLRGYDAASLYHGWFFIKRLAYTLTASTGPNLWRNRMLRQSATYGMKYRVRRIVHKTTRTDINFRILQAAVIIYLGLRNL